MLAIPDPSATLADNGICCRPRIAIEEIDTEVRAWLREAWAEAA